VKHLSKHDSKIQKQKNQDDKPVSKNVALHLYPPRPPASKEPASPKESRWVNRSEARNLRDTAKLIKSQQDKDTESEYDEDFTTVTKQTQRENKNN
jgi:hypothetical protein